MDKKIEVIQKVTCRLQDRLDDDTVSMVCDVLTAILDDYDITDRYTELGLPGDNGERELKAYIATKRLEGLSETTLRHYWYVDSELLRFLNKPVREITAFDLRFYLSYKRENGVGNRSLEGRRSCFSSFFAWLKAEGIIETNPCLPLTPIRYRQEVKKPFSAVELEKLRAVCKTKRDLAMIDFFYSTGCRVSEVASLKISDVDFTKAECKVVGKGNKERVVYLGPVALMHLEEYLESRNDGLDGLFVGKCGQLTKDGIEVALKRIGKAAGVDNVHPHRFRRTLATNLLDRGMSIQDVATILGHNDIKTTQIYCYISQENVQSAYKKYAN